MRTQVCSYTKCDKMPQSIHRTLILFCLLCPFTWGYMCPEKGQCDVNKCKTFGTCGNGLGLVPDFCGCCLVCARNINDTCNGPHGLYGTCDHKFTCVIQIQPGQLVTGDEQGICQYPDNACETLQTNFGCNIVGDRCRCSNVTSCVQPEFEFEKMGDCEIDLAVRLARRHESDEDCSKARCDVIHERQCPSDSKAIPADTKSSKIKKSICCPHNNFQCICDRTKCPKAPQCPVQYELIKIRSISHVPGQCCDKYECQLNGMNCTGVKCQDDVIHCPDDSYRLPNIISANSCCPIPQGCSCLPNQCKKVSCPGKSHVKFLKYGTGKPGSCCHVFKCVNVTEASCTYDGKKFEDTETWSSVDNCSECKCTNGLVFCKAVQCEHVPRCARMIVPQGKCCPVCIGCVSMSGALYNNSDEWSEDDCTTCKCENGQVNCQAAVCQVSCENPTYIPGQCCPVCKEDTVIKAVTECPPLNNCTLQCVDGMKKDSNGCYTCQCSKEIKDSSITNELAGEHSCIVGKIVYDEAATWFDGCRQCYCHKGKEMCALITCPVPKCSNPTIVKGQCCPQCAGGEIKTLPLNTSVATMTCQTVDGKFYVEGETWTVKKCFECICHGGQVLCEVQVCDPAPCPKPIYDDDKCCPYCPAISQNLPDDVEIPCLSEDGLIRYEDGEKWQPTSCRSCTCNHGYIDCYSIDCIAVKCNRPVLRKNQCCPVCLDSADGDSCKIDNVFYNHEEKWSTDECTSCVCLDGQVRCTKKLCSQHCINPFMTPGECCPICQGSSKLGEDKNSTSQESNTIYIPTKNTNKKDVSPPYAKPEEKQPYIMILCLTIISVLVLILLLLFFCCWRQRKKLQYYEHYVGPVTKSRPKSNNLDYTHERNAYCSSLYVDRNNKDCDYSMLGHAPMTPHYNTYSSPPVKNV